MCRGITDTSKDRSRPTISPMSKRIASKADGAAGRAQMTICPPTKIGDVLILRTEQTFAIHAVGMVSKVGQEDFRGQTNMEYVSSRAAAVAAARARLAPGARIFLVDIDLNEWSEISS
jgi:hypothetical protein